MALDFDDISIAIEDAHMTMIRADRAADGFARLLIGRLRHVQPWVATALKKELSNFNCRTGEWK